MHEFKHNIYSHGFLVIATFCTGDTAPMHGTIACVFVDAIDANSSIHTRGTGTFIDICNHKRLNIFLKRLGGVPIVRDANYL